MPNFASALKDEIVRLARKEIRVESEKFNKAKALLRAETSALKLRVVALEKEVAHLSKKSGKGKIDKVRPSEQSQIRFSPKGLVSLKRQLGLSPAEFGLLVGVSAPTIYNWEAEKSRPRQQQLCALASMRGIGKRQAAAKLKELAG